LFRGQNELLVGLYRGQIPLSNFVRVLLYEHIGCFLGLWQAVFLIVNRHFDIGILLLDKLLEIQISGFINFNVRF